MQLYTLDLGLTPYDSVWALQKRAALARKINKDAYTMYAMRLYLSRCLESEAMFERVLPSGC